MVQKGVDVGIITDLISLAYEGEYNRVVLTAGDGDFLDAIRKVQSIRSGTKHIEVFVAGYRSSMSKDMKIYADKLYYIQWEK